MVREALNLYWLACQEDIKEYLSARTVLIFIHILIEFMVEIGNGLEMILRKDRVCLFLCILIQNGNKGKLRQFLFPEN